MSVKWVMDEGIAVLQLLIQLKTVQTAVTF